MRWSGNDIQHGRQHHPPAWDVFVGGIDIGSSWQHRLPLMPRPERAAFHVQFQHAGDELQAGVRRCLLRQNRLQRVERADAA